MSDAPEILFDLTAFSNAAQGNGPVLGCALEDLNVTLLSWTANGQVAPHINNEVDVLLMGIEGTGEVTINSQVFMLAPGKMLLIAKGSERAARSTSDKFSYLSVHRRRAGLMPTPVKQKMEK